MGEAGAVGRRALAAVDSHPQADAVEVDREWLRSVGMQVLVARTVRRESQESLSRRAGVARVTVGAIERGEHPASVLSYARLGAVLGLPLNELLDGYDLPPGRQRRGEGPVSGREVSPRVVVDGAVMGGAPCIGGTRLRVATVLGLLADYDSPDSVLADYPQLSSADLRAAVRYAADVLDRPARDLPEPGRAVEVGP